MLIIQALKYRVEFLFVCDDLREGESSFLNPDKEGDILKDEDIVKDEEDILKGEEDILKEKVDSSFRNVPQEQEQNKLAKEHLSVFLALSNAFGL